MAFNPINVFPNDLNPRVAIGVDIPFNSTSVFRSNFQTKEAIKNNLINFLLTNQGERIGNPNFGGNIREFIFEQISLENIEFLKEDLQLKIQNIINNINIEEIQVIPNFDTNQINIKINYSIPNTNIEDELSLNFE